MVPREPRAEVPPKRVQLLLSRARGALDKPIAAGTRFLRGGIRAIRERDSSALKSPTAVQVGLVALLIGALVRISAAPGSGRAEATLGAAFAVLWALARLAILALTVKDLRRESSAFTGAWAIGLITWSIAGTSALAALAWLSSGFITLTALEGLGEGRRSARRAVVTAWGAHGAFEVIVWLATNAWIATLATY